MPVGSIGGGGGYPQMQSYMVAGGGSPQQTGLPNVDQYLQAFLGQAAQALGGAGQPPQAGQVPGGYPPQAGQAPGGYPPTSYPPPGGQMPGNSPAQASGGALQPTNYTQTGIPSLDGQGYAYKPGSAMTSFLDGINQQMAAAGSVAPGVSVVDWAKSLPEQQKARKAKEAQSGGDKKAQSDSKQQPASGNGGITIDPQQLQAMMNLLQHPELLQQLLQQQQQGGPPQQTG